MEKNHRRDALFLTLSGIFLTSLVLGNVIGTTKFVTIFSLELPAWLEALTPKLVRSGSTYTMSVPAGVIAYPFTFLATDLISELFGRKRAQMLVWVGFGMNVFMLILMSVNHWLPNSAGVSGGLDLFEGVYQFMVGNTIASMIAYLIAQSVDVRMYHFWKRLTKGKHLWLRNNGSTVVSQGVDSFMVISVTFGAQFFAGAISAGSMLALMGSNYLFKLCVALADTLPFYFFVNFLTRYLELTEEELKANGS